MRKVSNQLSLANMLVLWMAAAHLSVSVLVVGLQVSSYRDSTIQHLSVLSDAVSLALIDSVAFADRNLAAQDLRTFGTDPNIIRVCFWDTSGDLFASFDGPVANDQRECASSAPGSTLSWSGLSLHRAISFDGKQLGSLSILSDTAPLRAQIAQSLIISIVLLGGSIMTAFFLSSQLVSRLEKKVEDRTRELELARKRSEEANEAKSRFIANMSHELRTPMNGLMGTIERLFDTDLEIDQSSLVERALGSGRYLLGMLNSVLDFTKAEAGMFELEREDCDVAMLVQSVIETHKDAARASDISLEYLVEPHPLRFSRTNPGGLQRVLHNLVGNAIKFTNEGGVLVHVDFRAGDEPQILCSVRDTGIGIDPSKHDRLFTPFSQADDSTTRRFQGTGLGLAISRHVVESLGGEMEFSSRVGHGSVFSFSIPCEAGIAPEGTTGTAPSKIVPPELRARVLVVEDSEINREIAEAAVVATGCRVVSAENGKRALEMLETECFDLILMDCHMPEMDGYETTRRIRSFASESATSASVPIIAVTASARSTEREHCLSIGMDFVVAKPFGRAELWDALRVALSSSDSSDDGSSPMDVDSVDALGAGDSQAALINHALLAEITDTVSEGGDELRRRVIGLFVDGLPQARSAIVDAANAGGSESLRKAAHALKSTSLNIGAAQLAECASQIEDAAARGEALPESSLGRLEKIAVATQRAYEAEREA